MHKTTHSNAMATEMVDDDDHLNIQELNESNAFNCMV